jgi:hypothetical protein
MAKKTTTPVSVRLPVTLRYQWTKGDALRYRRRTLETARYRPPGARKAVNDRSVGRQVVRLVAERVAGDGRATITRIIDSARLTTTSQMVKPFQKLVAAIVGEPIRVVIAPTGEVLRVTGTKKLVDKILAEAGLTETTSGDLQGQKRVMNEVLQKGIRQDAITFPARAVRRGARWRAEFEVPPPISCTLSITSTLNKVERRGTRTIARIGQRFALTRKRSTAPADATAFAIKVRSATGRGEVLFDVDNGRVVQWTTTLKMRSVLPTSTPEGKVTSMKMNTTGTFSLRYITG